MALLSSALHTSSVTKVAFYHLRNTARITPYLSLVDANKLPHAFVFSHLDYCNALYSGLPNNTHWLQHVQNSAARILTKTRKRDHIPPVKASLHWLPVTLRMDFKILSLVFKAQNGLAPSYLSDCLSEYAPNRSLRSLNAGLLNVPHMSGKKFGEAAFCSYAPKIWNALPPQII